MLLPKALILSLGSGYSYDGYSYGSVVGIKAIDGRPEEKEEEKHTEAVVALVVKVPVQSPIAVQLSRRLQYQCEVCSSLTTTGCACCKAVRYWHMKGVVAPKKQILAVERLEAEVQREKKKAADAEERSTMLVERVSAQEDELNSLKEQMGSVLAKLTELVKVQSGET